VFVTECNCYSFHNVLGSSRDDFDAVSKALKFRSRLGYDGVLRAILLEMSQKKDTFLSNFPRLRECIDDLCIHARKYGTGDMTWIMFKNCSCVTRFSPCDKKDQHKLRWLSRHVTKYNNQPVSTIEVSSLQERVELQTAHTLIEQQKRELEELIEKEKERIGGGEDEKPKKKRKVAVQNHKIGDTAVVIARLMNLSSQELERILPFCIQSILTPWKKQSLRIDLWFLENCCRQQVTADYLINLSDNFNLFEKFEYTIEVLEGSMDIMETLEDEDQAEANLIAAYTAFGHANFMSSKRDDISWERGIHYYERAKERIDAHAGGHRQAHESVKPRIGKNLAVLYSEDPDTMEKAISSHRLVVP